MYLLDAGYRLGAKREKPGKVRGAKDTCPEHDQGPGSGLSMSLQLGESFIYTLEILLRISYKFRPLISSGDKQLCHLLSV